MPTLQSNRSSKCSVIVFLLTVLIVAATTIPCFTAEAGLGPYWPGFRNFLAGVVPTQPGLYLRNDVVFYSSTASRVVLNGLPVDNVSATVWADIVEPFYVMPQKVFGATHMIVVTQPFVWAKLSGHIIGTDINPSGTRSSHADTIFSPLLLGWQRGYYHYNTNLAIFIPTASFDIHRVANTGRNFWTFDPEFAFTYLNPETGWDLSGVLGCTFSTKNAATQYQTGDILHLDYAIGRISPSGLEAGIVGYVEQQISPDSGSGAIFGSFESSVWGLGPAVQWRPANGPLLTFRYFHEFGEHNHLVGDQAAFTVRLLF